MLIVHQFRYPSYRFVKAITRSDLPEGNSYIERFHRSLKEEEVWTSEYRPDHFLPPC